ncbi:MAG TPA: DUF2330 domain-containing protein [Kofleriaceae bacterium]|nr:DUF2330 domain-containing protein [Kofleriaceae bacterium]
MKRSALLVAASAALTLPAATADAFCGFYVAGGDQKLFNDATQVVLMRKGTRTVLAMQNNYQGPPEAFAMVVPVPVVLHEADVKTLRKDVFEHVEQMGAPRLVEYWEQDPCEVRKYELDGVAMTTSMPAPSGAAEGSKGLGVTIEARFAVGEYQIVILSAKDSTGLDTWLKQEKYHIPDGAEPLLRPYVEGGSKFFVAKVDPAKVTFGPDQRAQLSPLRFHYDSDEFSLPIRLGLANSSGTQDLIVNILAPGQRYEVANYRNVTIPTNLDVRESVKDKFAGFYTALFDRTIENNPGAVVTEYAWQASTCDPCPGPTLDQSDFLTLGADVLDGPRGQATPYQGYDLVLTRLHARYGKTITNDLVFAAAKPIVGGREFVRGGDGTIEEGAKAAEQNNFQARYAIRHAWTGPITCEHPQRHVWGGPPSEIARQPGFAPGGIKPATGLAFAARGEVALAQVVLRDIPEIGVKAGASAAPAPSPTASAPGSAAAPPADTAPAKKRPGCGCATTGRDDVLGGAFLIGASLLVRRRRRR